MKSQSVRPGFMFCMCPDGRLLQREIARLLKNFPPASSSFVQAKEGWTRHIFWGDTELPPSFWEDLTLQGLFATPLAIIIRNAHNLTAETWKLLDKTLARGGNLTWTFLCIEGEWEKKQPKIPAHIKKLRCLAFAEKQGWVWKQATLDKLGVRNYIKEAAKNLKLSFEPDALELLTISLPSDAASIDNEINKLALLSEDGIITSDQSAITNYTPDFDIFTLLREIQTGQSVKIWEKILREEERKDGLIFPLLGLLQREARLLWQIRAGENPYIHQSYALAKRETATRLGFTGLMALWEAMHTAEFSIKNGERSPQQALNALIGDLTRIFSP